MKYQKIIIFLSALIIFNALVVITGWVFGIDRLTRFLPNQINMKFATSICFLLCGIALPFISQAVREKKEAARLILPGITMFILLIMATLLAANLLRVQTGIEGLFVKDLGNSQTVIPGAPAVPTMICFILFGAASMVSLFSHRNLNKLIRGFGISILLIGLVAVLGYLFNLPFLFYKFTQTTTAMALNTGVLFLLIGLTLFFIGNHEN